MFGSAADRHPRPHPAGSWACCKYGACLCWRTWRRCSASPRCLWTSCRAARCSPSTCRARRSAPRSWRARAGPLRPGQGDALNLHADARAPLGAPPPAAAASGRGGAGRPSAPGAGRRVDAAARAAAGLLHSRFERLCPALDYQAVVAAAREQARSGPAVVHAAHARMHVAAVSDVHVVSFVPCRGAAAPAAAAEVSRPLQEREPLHAVGTSCTACKQTDAPV